MKLFRAVDFETTGFPPNAEVIEVGTTDIIYTSPEDIKIIPRRPRLCKPSLPIEIGAMATHHIREEDLEGAPSPIEVMEAELTPSATQPIWAYCAHNAPFEEKFFDFARPIVDTLRLARRFSPGWKQHTNQYCRYALHVDSEPDFCIDYAMPPHRGGPDSYVNAFVLRKMLRRNTIEELIKFSSEPTLLPKIHFGKHKGKTYEEVDISFLRWVRGNPQAEPDVLFTANYWYEKRTGQS